MNGWVEDERDPEKAVVEHHEGIEDRHGCEGLSVGFLENVTRVALTKSESPLGDER